jgi:ribosomal protein L16 Arg81 hydroxylase
MGALTKNFCSFEEKVDFNFISNLLDRNNLSSQISSNFLNNFIFESVFKISLVEQDSFFYELFNLLQNKFNNLNKKSDLDLYFSLVSGNKSITHRDGYDVYILGVYGKTLYRVNDEDFIVEKGDLLYIPKNELHKAIGLTPRITLSYGIY